MNNQTGEQQTDLLLNIIRDDVDCWNSTYVKTLDVEYFLNHYQPISTSQRERLLAAWKILRNATFETLNFVFEGPINQTGWNISYNYSTISGHIEKDLMVMEFFEPELFTTYKEQQVVKELLNVDDDSQSRELKMKMRAIYSEKVTKTLEEIYKLLRDETEKIIALLTTPRNKTMVGAQ